MDDSPLFFLTWYSIAVAAVTAVGALVGSRLLRW
ncbi:NrsF family protein [Xanthobacter autotrophicus]